MSNKGISILLVGIGGFGNIYLSDLLFNRELSNFTIAGVVDVKPENSRYYDTIQKRNIPVYSSMEEFFAQGKVDLTIISTPIQFHCPQTILALENGSNVLCEKPIAATVQDARKMMEAQKKSGKFVAIGYGWSYSDQIQKLKQDILSGEFGKPKRLKTVALWSRSQDYFQRSGWAGKQKGSQGEWILDSVAHNATSHFLHNMFYLLGPSLTESAKPKNVSAELYRANAIENFDTIATRVQTEQGIEILFYATHAVLDSLGPRFNFEFENAVITYEKGVQNDLITAKFNDGSHRVYQYDSQYNTKKLRLIMEAAAGENQPVLCDLQAAFSEVLCMNGVQESVPEIGSFPKELVKFNESNRTVWVEGLREELLRCYGEWVLPSEAGVDWAKKGKEIDLTDYREFRLQ